ncbi:MAG: PQQ-binding-like beta-propeller repeat protein [Alphaproteobacteria bacterium]|nr:PQQ-binding-like beta-propeller repeat protein [Alphaproteobacteria bacterium]
MTLRMRFFACAALAALAGCDTVNNAEDSFNSLTSGWFTSIHRSNIKGQRISVLSEDESLKPDPDLASTKVVLPKPYRNPAWPQPGGYAANVMYHLEAAGPLAVAWTQQAGKGSDSDSRLTAAPIVAEGRAYVLDAQAHLYCFDARTGAAVWDKALAPYAENTFLNSASFGLMGKNTSIDPSKGFGGGVAFDGGRLFVTTGFGEVFALDGRNGKQIWKTELLVPIVNAPVASGGRIFVSSEDNHFYALAANDGRKLWDHQGITENAGILESTSAAVAGDYVIAPYTSGELYALRVADGRAAWSEMLTRSGSQTALSELDDIAGRPVVDRDMVYAISHSGVMAAINLNTGERAWGRDLGGIQTPWAAGDFVYVLSIDSRLICLARKTGKVKWIHQLPRYEDEIDKSDAIIWTGPVLVSDRLIVVSSNGRAYSISPYTGQLLGKTEIPDGAFIPPVVANGTLYLLTNGAQLVALR